MHPGFVVILHTGFVVILYIEHIVDTTLVDYYYRLDGDSDKRQRKARKSKVISNH